MYYTYVLFSTQHNRLYVGSTEDIDKRIKKHNSGSVRSTKAYRPYELIYKEEHPDKTQAIKRELFLKSGQGRRWIREAVLPVTSNLQDKLI